MAVFLYFISQLFMVDRFTVEIFLGNCHIECPLGVRDGRRLRGFSLHVSIGAISFLREQYGRGLPRERWRKPLRQVPPKRGVWPERFALVAPRYLGHG